MLKKRGIRALIITLLVALSASCFSLMFANLVSVFTPEQNEQPPAKAADLTITELQGLKNFAAEVNNGNTFEGKVVELRADIDCNGENVQIGKNYTEREEQSDGMGGTVVATVLRRSSFKGVFDGKGYTISNINYTTTNNIGTDVQSVPKNSEGLFVNNYGTIKNLRVKDSYIYISSGGSPSIVGVIAGQNSGTITSCIVENVEFFSNKLQRNLDVAAIAGENSGNVTSCLVTGNYKMDEDRANGGMDASYFVVSGNEATNSIFVATVEVLSGDKEDFKEPKDNDNNAFEDWTGNYSSFSSAYSSMAEAVCSNTTGESGTAWYKYNVNCGFNADTTVTVYLRSFITWKTYSFSSNDASYGTVSHSSVTAPTGYHTVTDSGNNKIVYGTTITPTPKPDCEFTSWTGNETNGFVANFKQSLITLTFKALAGTDKTTDQTFTVAPNTPVTTTRSPDGSSITYEFAGVSVTYTISSDENYFTTLSSTVTCSSSQTFTPAIAAKKFGVTFI